MQRVIHNAISLCFLLGAMLSYADTTTNFDTTYLVSGRVLQANPSYVNHKAKLWKALPSQSTTINFDWQSDYISNFCPGCIQQYYIGIPNIVDSCFFSGNTRGTRFGEDSLTFNAPATSGVYPIVFHSTLEYQCIDVKPHMREADNSIAGYLVVEDMEGYRLLISELNGKCLDVHSETKRLVMADCNGNKSQLWKLDNQSAELWNKSWHCVDTAPLNNRGAKAVTYRCNGSAEQRWSMNANTGQIKHISTSWCLDVEALDHSVSTPVNITRCMNFDNQKWFFF